MTREEVSKIFVNATEEQINALLDINSSDIGKAKKTPPALKTKNKALTEKIAEYEKADRRA